jgi:putative phage-type endonuclease
MKTIDLIQNSAEWLEFRKTRIGASDANIIMGVSEFMTPFQLWQKRLGLVQEEDSGPNFIQAKGHRLEPQLRSILELHTGHDFTPVVVVNDDFPAFMASLDGWCEELKATAEFKYVGQDAFDLVSSGEMLDHYIPQVQQQLFLTNSEDCYFMVGADDKESGGFKFAWILVKRDQDYIEKKLLPTVHAFIDCVNENRPPKLTHNDTYDQSLDTELDEMLCRYKLMTDEQKELESRIDSLKANIFKHLHHTKVNCNGVMLYDIQAKDGVKIDYEGFIEKSGLVVSSEFISVKKGAKTKKIVFPKEKA